MNVRLHATLPNTKAAARRKQDANVVMVDVVVDETMAFSIAIPKARATLIQDGEYLADFIAKHVSEKIKAAFPGFMKVTRRHEDGYDFEDSVQFNRNVRIAG